MASRLIHLAAGKELVGIVKPKDENRFLLGCLLPDGVFAGGKIGKRKTHFAVHLSDGEHKIMDYRSFYHRYEKLVKSDELYLGYLFHLIEDCVFRQQVYYDMGLLCKRRTDGFSAALYHDYNILNSYLVEKYGLDSSVKVTENFCNEAINEIYTFEIEELVRQLKADFEMNVSGEPIYYGQAVADKLVSDCVRLCAADFKNIKNGMEISNPCDYVWELVNEMPQDK